MYGMATKENCLTKTNVGGMKQAYDSFEYPQFRIFIK